VPSASSQGLPICQWMRMKLGSLKPGRDGRLVVVRDDLDQ
jgi:hypothetical protein